MTDRLDRLLGETMHDLAVDADVISERDRGRLAVHAIDRAHTLRTRRRSAITAVVILATALAVGVPYGLRYLGSWLHPAPAVVALPAGVVEIPGVPTHVIDDTSKPIELVDGWYVAGNRMVLNPTTRSYQTFGQPTVAMLSPNGRWVATSGDLSGYRLYDLERGGNTRYDVGGGSGFDFTTFYGVARWSPDGDSLLTTYERSRTIFGEQVEAATLTRTYATIPAPPEPCPYCELMWMPSGTELVTPVAASDDRGMHVTGLQTFALDGTPRALLPIRGIPAGVGAWSPDGRYVVVDGEGPEGFGPQLVDVATGEVAWSQDRGILAQAQWIDNRRFLLWEPILPEDWGATEVMNPYRAIVSLRTIDGDLLERWIPPAEIVRINAGSTVEPLAIHLG